MFTYVYPYLVIFTYVCTSLPTFTRCLFMFNDVYSFTYISHCLVVYIYRCLIVFAYVNTTLPMFSPVYSCLTAFIRFYLCFNVLQCLAPVTSACLPMLTPVYSCIHMFIVFTYFYTFLTMFTRFYLYSLVFPYV